MENLNWINLNFIEFNWTKEKLEVLNEFYTNLEGAICILALKTS